MKRPQSHQPGDETLAVKASNEKKEENDPRERKAILCQIVLRVSYLHDLFKWLLSCEGVCICKIRILEEVSWELRPLEGKPKVRYQP